ncbi:unnamed protein product, partial [Iphiclides podalirius]
MQRGSQLAAAAYSNLSTLERRLARSRALHGAQRTERASERGRTFPNGARLPIAQSTLGAPESEHLDEFTFALRTATEDTSPISLVITGRCPKRSHRPSMSRRITDYIHFKVGGASMSDVEWTNDLAIRLMMEYKKRPELWDSSHDLYRVHTAKYEAWSELANLFECDIVDLRKKLNSIFASHRREKAKVRCGGRSTWFLYPHMSFLPTHIGNDETSPASERRRRILNLPVEKPEPSSAESAEEDHAEEDTQSQEVIVKSEPAVEYPRPRAKREVRCVGRKARVHKVVKRRVVKDNDDDRARLIETIRLLRRSDLLKKKDECDSFGEYIADSLRKHDDRTQSMIKQAINNILFEQEMKRYSSNQYAVVIPSMDENPLILGDTESK